MFKANQPLAQGETYTAQVSFYDGLGRTSEKVWSFQTAGRGEASANTTNLSNANTSSNTNQLANQKNLVLTNASMGVGTIRSDAPMEVSFSEALDVASLKSAPIQLYENNRPVGIDYRLSKDLKTVTVSPRNAMKANASYAITIEKSIASTSGKKLAKKTLIPFKVSDNNEAGISQYELEERPANNVAVANNQMQMNQQQNYYQPVQQSVNQNYVPMQQNYQNVQQRNVQNQQYAMQSSGMNYNQPTQTMQSNIENPFANQSNAMFTPNMSNYASNQLQVARAQAELQQNRAPVAEQVQLTGLAPQNGAKISNLTQPVTIAFSDEIKAETLNEFTFRLEDDFGPVPAKIHYFKGHKQATLTPIGLLDAEKNYRVIVTQGITDLYGRPIKSGVNSMFATITSAATPAMPSMPNTPTQNYTAKASPLRDAQELESFDNNNKIANSNNLVAENYNQNNAYNQIQSNSYANSENSNKLYYGADKTVRTSVKDEVKSLSSFKVSSIYPGLNSDNISRKSKIAVHFSEPCDPKTVNNINISVFANQTRVDGKVTYDRRNNRAIFEPTRPLEARTEHKVIVSDKILSKSGESLAQRFSWTFSTTADTRNQYVPTVAKTAEADAAFYIPLVDSKVKMTPSQSAALNQKASNSNTSTTSFSYVPSKHWSFKSMKHITNKGILSSYPFTFTDSVTRYEFASAINNALNNLKQMQNTNSTKLRVADMIELEQLIIEYKNELKSYGVNTQWFESFLQNQGVNLNEVETKVRKLNS